MNSRSFRIATGAVVAAASLALAGAASADLSDGSVLVGLTTDGTVYLDSSSDGFCHWIPDLATFNGLGYDSNAITWYGDLPCTVGDPLPALASPAASPAETPVAPAGVAAAKQTLSASPVIGAPKAASARAGKPFTVAFPVTGGTAFASVKVGTSTLRSSVKLAQGVATVGLTIPAAAKGNLLHVALTVESDGAKATRAASYRVA
ncbi:MAG: hypothetical protein JO064_07660 [Actinobacteria bacterium]|nr:hypothetical protein [Actinomycetota bacterium]